MVRYIYHNISHKQSDTSSVTPSVKASRIIDYSICRVITQKIIAPRCPCIYFTFQRVHAYMKNGECGSKHKTEGEAEMAKTNKQGNKKTKRTTDGVCFSNCQMNRKENDSMIQCHICQIWAHIQCIDVSDDDIISIWCCNNCRNLPHNVLILCDKRCTIQSRA